MKPARTALRRRLALGGVAVIVATAVVLTLSGGGSGSQPPATGAASIVPADALAYVHVSTDASRSAVRRFLAQLARFPDYPRLSTSVQARLGAIAAGSAPVDFERDIRPWLGREAALALLNTTTATAGSLLVLDVRNRSRALSFLVRAGAVPAGSYHGTPLRRYSSGAVLAFVGHYLALGQDASLREAIDVAAGRVGSLSSDSGYRRAAAGEPAGRVLDAYASAVGVQRVLASRRGIVGALGVLLDQPALGGVSVSVSPAAGGARVQIHSVLDPALATLSASRPPSFAPALQHLIPGGSTLLLDVSGLDTFAPRLLAAVAAGGVAGQIGPLLARVGAALASEGVNVHDLVSIFHGESAVAIAPAGTGSASHAPTLLIVARLSDQAQARTELASLQVPLAQLFAPAAGAAAAPGFSDHQIAGVDIYQLALNPGLQLDYAVFDGVVAISTGLGGIEALVRHASPLAADPRYTAALRVPPQKVTSLLFLDFSQLLSLGEQTGLIRSARVRALGADLQRIRAVGLESTSGEADSTAELFLQIP